MNDKNRNLLLRIGSALVLLPVVVFLLWKGGMYSAGLMGFAAACCTGEYYAITTKRHFTLVGIVGTLAAGVMPILPVAAYMSAFEGCFWIIGGMFIFAWAYHLIRGPLAEAPVLSAHFVTGMVYGAVGLTALSAMRNIRDGLWWVICTLVITWLNDTFAYFFGRFLGKRKLYPEVSPNKTWEGFFGGMLGSIVGMLVMRQFFFGHALTLLDCVAIGVIGGTFGPIGDLCESMLKRAYGVKDSGKILPGHGGMLDRIDALIFNAPLVFVYVRFVKGWM